MNIVVFSSDSNVFVRPDTTWERDNEDLYVPEFINTLSWTPVLFARISKPGRSISSKFASRYYDGIGYGVLLYPEDLISKGPEGFASACCVDHTSFLTFPTYPPTRLDGQDGRFNLSKDGTHRGSFQILLPAHRRYSGHRNRQNEHIVQKGRRPVPHNRDIRRRLHT